MVSHLNFKEQISTALSKPLELIIGLSIFAAAAGGGTVAHAASISMVVLLITSLLYVRSWASLWRQRSTDERLMLFAFALYFLSAVLSYYNVEDTSEYFKHLERYLRLFLIIPIYLLLSKADLKLFPYLLAGAIVSGPLYLGTALWSFAESLGRVAQGAYHHITFGDMAMLGALFMMAVLTVMKTSRLMKAALVVSILCLLYASVLSQARGAWLALPFALLVLVPVAVHNGKMKFRTVVIAFIVLGSAIALSPAKDILSSRIQLAVQEAEGFQNEANHSSSVGSRIAMWHVALDVWKKHPIIGTGPGDFDVEFVARQALGDYTDTKVNSSTHSIYFQALATTGTLGLVALGAALFLVPFRFFYKTNRQRLNVAATSGMVVLVAFAVFGLTEAWTLRSPVVSVYLVYFVTLATAASRESEAS